MNSKKLITLLVLTTMLLSMFPLVMTGAITSPVFYDSEDIGGVVLTNVQKGDEVAVTGTDVTAGKDVEVYWDLVQPWSSTDHEGLLEVGKAEPSGDYEVNITIPETTGGTHWVWVRDTQTGETDKESIVVDAKISASSTSGLPDDRVDLDGYSFDDEEDVAVMLVDDDVAPTVTPEAGEGHGTTTDDVLTYEFTLDEVPILPDSVTITIATVGDLDDDAHGDLTGVGTGTVNYITGEVDITIADPDGALAITAAYDWFEAADDTCEVYSLTAETNKFGTVERRVTIPDWTNSDYYFWIMNGEGYYATKQFDVGPVISLDVEEGPVGTVVEVRGRGFDGYDITELGGTVGIDWDQIEADDITIDGTTCYVFDAPVEVDTDGEFKLDIMIPQVADEDEYTITVAASGDEGNTATADFEVLGLAEIEVSPSFGIQGSTVTIEGWNFSAISGEDVSIELWVDDYDPLVPGDKVVDIDELETDSNGHFEETITIPARASDPYYIRAIQTTYDIDADDGFRIGMMIVIASPEDGPTGTKVTLSGTGFTKSGSWNATFGPETITDEDPVDDEGNLEMDGSVPTFYVPTLDPGVYTITVLDIDAEIDVELEWEVTATTMIELDPMVGPQDYNFTIMGKYFSATEDNVLEFVLWNETDDWEMDVFQMWDHDDNEATDNIERVAETNEDGNFTAYWDFNDGDIELDVGTYWINCTDEHDLFAQISFSVVEKTVDIDPRKATFRIGDTVAFNVESSFSQEDSYIKVWDPDDNLYWQTDEFIPDVWLKVGTIMRVPYYEQVAGGNPMTLLDDAPLGTWSWKWYDNEDDLLDSGTFQVEAAQESVLTEQVADLNEAMADLSDEISTVSDAVAGVQSDVNSAIAAANAAVEAANAAVDAVNSVAGTASQAAEAAQNAADAAESAQNAASGLTTLVYGAIGASLVAALAAIVSLMQISRRIAG